MRWTILLALLPSLAFAQSQSTPRPEDLGTVTGHITCADTQRPARFARVRLVPKDSVDNGESLSFVQTDISGAYTIRDVQPGEYYLRVDLAGYIDPLFESNRGKPTAPENKQAHGSKQSADTDPDIITVAGRSELRSDVILHHAAAISGTVRYDDGSPAVGLGVRITAADADDNDLNEGQTVTDSRGRYLVESLIPGSYIVAVRIDLSEQRFVMMRNTANSMIPVLSMGSSFGLTIYSGNVTHGKKAVPVKAEAGEETSGADITIPTNQLHNIYGTVLAPDGHPINFGTVALLYADDRSFFSLVAVDSDDGSFHFAYVPDGNFILSVQNARDIDRAKYHPDAYAYETVRTYGTLEKPVTVHTDIQSLTLTIPDKPSTTAPKNSTGDN